MPKFQNEIQNSHDMFGTLCMDLNIQYAVPRQNTFFFFSIHPKPSQYRFIYLHGTYVWEKKGRFLKSKKKEKQYKNVNIGTNQIE